MSKHKQIQEENKILFWLVYCLVFVLFAAMLVGLAAGAVWLVGLA